MEPYDPTERAPCWPELDELSLSTVTGKITFTSLDPILQTRLSHTCQAQLDRIWLGMSAECSRFLHLHNTATCFKVCL